MKQVYLKIKNKQKIERHLPKSKLIASLLALFLGFLGIHDFYLGYRKKGILKIVLTVGTGIGGGMYALVDFIRLITDGIYTDAAGNELKKEF